MTNVNDKGDIANFTFNVVKYFHQEAPTRKTVIKAVFIVNIF